MDCELCEKEIDGKPFALSNLDDPPRILNVCETCATFDWITLDYDIGCDEEVEVEVNRDDLIVADRRRFGHAVEGALSALEDQGWSCESMRIKAINEDRIKEPAW